MTLSNSNSTAKNVVSQPSSSPSPHAPAWYCPTVSPEHGVYVVLLVSSLTGAAAAQQWTLATTLAFICAFAGFQAEHPLVLQIKQRRSWKPRFLLWGSLYAGLSLGIAVYLYLQVSTLLWLYLGAIVAFLVDAISVFYRQQKSVFNELLTFAAVCLAAPFAYVATTGTWTASLIGLWLLNTLFFSSAIFTVKLRKPKTASLMPGIVYHAIASLIVVGLWSVGWLAPFSAVTFTLILLKFSFILWRLDWYKTTQIQNVAFLETITAMLFLATLAISLLPAHLSR
ncbi:MAG: YwiC-like family protein [Coleofasciculaceae cyanobacterium]